MEQTTNGVKIGMVVMVSEVVEVVLGVVEEAVGDSIVMIIKMEVEEIVLDEVVGVVEVVLNVSLMILVKVKVSEKVLAAEMIMVVNVVVLEIKEGLVEIGLVAVDVVDLVVVEVAMIEVEEDLAVVVVGEDVVVTVVEVVLVKIDISIMTQITLHLKIKKLNLMTE